MIKISFLSSIFELSLFALTKVCTEFGASLGKPMEGFLTCVL